MIQVFIAVTAGILTIGAPCILPILPILLGGSVGQRNKTRPIYITLGFILTFTGVALVFSVFTSILGLSQQQLRTAAILFLGIFGLFLIWPAPFEHLSLYLGKYISRASQASNRIQGNFGAFVLGATLGLVWTPCAGPVLGSILTLIATSADLGRAGILLTAYALGAGIPMLLIAYGGQYVSGKISGIARYSSRIQQAFGVIIFGLAIAMYYQYDLVIQGKIIEHFPSIVPNL